MMGTLGGVGGMGAYRGTGASRSIATRRGESGMGVDVVIASRRALTLGRSRGETVSISSGGVREGRGVAKPEEARTLIDGSSRSSRTWGIW